MRAMVFLSFCLPAIGLAAPYTLVAGNVRIQVISPHLVRLEQKGPKGFEDRPTFTVVNRDFARTNVKVRRQSGLVLLETETFTVITPSSALTLRDVQVLDSVNRPIYQFNGTLPPVSYLPAPGKVGQAWPMSDHPRLVPPSWGATPPPPGLQGELAAKSGWDDRNDAPDVYVFVPGNLGYAQIRADFVRLTGPIPKPPLYMMGFIDSRYYPYTEKEALDSIDAYRKKRIPIDTFVVDTDWRVNGSAGYEGETKLLPDMGRFIQSAHDRHVKLMFNDHPDPKTQVATDPAELQFRWQGLTKLLNMGMDVWWYDRNWSTSLREPMPEIRKEVWGQRLYHDITERARPTSRPWIMTNAEGIDNGIEHYAPHPAGHRFPMMWTGDTGSQFAYLKRGVENGVSRGILALQPYTHEDLGGHTGPNPSPELYVRYLEYGCLSPITRVHCTRGQDRHPWAFGPEAEQIVTDYIKLRYRLLPTLYTAAQHATDDGTPLLRRCDLYWPTFAEAAANDQYMLGDDLLIAPIVESSKGDPIAIPSELFRTPLGGQGLRAEYFDNPGLVGTPKHVQTDAKIDFDWSGKSPVDGVPSQNFSVRWSGLIGPIPTTGKYHITSKSDDGIRVFVDGKAVIDDWKPEDSAVNEAVLSFEAGTSHSIRVEYMQLTGGAVCKLGWQAPSSNSDSASHRSVWIPPGLWNDVWTGTTVIGPKVIRASAELNQIPMWVAAGAIVFTGPEMQSTVERPIDPMTADIYLAPESSSQRELVEDDGQSVDYLHGAIARTVVTSACAGPYAAIRLGATHGSFVGQQHERNWVVRAHLPKGASASLVRLDGKPVEFKLESHKPVQMPFLSGSAPEEGEVVRIILPTTAISREHNIVIELK